MNDKMKKEMSNCIVIALLLVVFVEAFLICIETRPCKLDEKYYQSKTIKEIKEKYNIPATEEMVYDEADYQVRIVYGDGYSLDKNIDRLKYLVDEDSWNNLDLKEKQECITALVEYEAYNMGLPFELLIQFSDDMRYETKASYSNDSHLIRINNEALMKDKCSQNLVSAFHELRHCEQNIICDIYSRLSSEERNLRYFQGVEEWCKNLNNYSDGYDDYDEYFSQPLEDDARRYSVKRAEEFEEQILDMIEEEK